MPRPVWKYENNVLVVAGGWNANILLNSVWLKKFLFPNQEKFGIEIPFDTVAQPPRISTDHMRISISGPRLCFSPLSDDTSQLDEIENTMLLVSDFLPHTPVSAMGTNFLFDLDDDTQLIACRSKLADDVLGQIGDIREEQYRYSLSEEKGLLNVILLRDTEGKCSCEFNFHHKISCIAEVKEVFSYSHITEYRKRSDDLLTKLVSGLRK